MAAAGKRSGGLSFLVPTLAGILIGLFVWRYWGGRCALWGKTWTAPGPGEPGRVALEWALAGGIGACWALWVLVSRCLRDFRGMRPAAARRRAARNFSPAGALLLPLAWDALGFGYSIFSLSFFGVVIGLTLWVSIAPFVALADVRWPGPKAARRALVAAMLVFFAVFGGVAVMKLQAQGFGYRDSGIYGEAIVNTLRGRFLYTNYYGGCYLGDHVSPIMVALCPFMAAFPSVATLLLIQAAALALAAPAVYRIGRRAMKSRLAGLLLALGYLANPVVDHLNFAHVWGFHVVTLAVPLMLWAFDALIAGRTARFWVFLVLALACKEDVAVVTFMLGPFIFFSLRRRGLAVVVSAVGLAWLVLSLKVVSPLFWGGEYRYFSLRWGHLGATTGQILLNAPLALVRALPETKRLAFLLHLAAPLAFAPLGAFWALLALVPSVALLIVSDEERFHSIMCQTTATLVPVLFLATAWAVRVQMKRLAGRRQAWGARLLERVSMSRPDRVRPVGQVLAAAPFVFCVVFHALLAPSPLAAVGPDVFNWYSVAPGPRSAALRRLAKRIPPDASVAATDKAAVHFIAQPDLYVVDVKKLGKREEAELDKAEYVLLDLRLPEDQRHSVPARDRLLKKKSHGLVAHDAGFALFRRGAETIRPRPVKDASAMAKRMAFRPPRSPLSTLVCLGADARPVGEGVYRITSLWTLRRKTGDAVIPKLLFRRSDGREAQLKPFILFDRTFPTYLWRPGESYLDATDVELPFAPDPANTELLVGEGTVSFAD